MLRRSKEKPLGMGEEDCQISPQLKAIIEANRKAALARKHALLKDSTVNTISPASLIKTDNTFEKSVRADSLIIDDDSFLDEASIEDSLKNTSKNENVKEPLTGQPFPAQQQQQQKKRHHPINLQIDSRTTFTASAFYQLLPICRSIPGAAFVKAENAWRMPLTELQAFLKKIPPEFAPLTTPPKAVLEEVSKEKDAANSQDQVKLEDFVEEPLLSALFPFQRQAVQFAIQRRGRLILADEMGLGKSLQALAMASYYRMEWPLLILTPASMVATWQEQCLRWLPFLQPESVQAMFEGERAASSKKKLSKDSSNGDFEKKSSKACSILILSYDMAVRQAASHLKPGTFAVIIADESHMLRNRETKRCKQLLPVLKAATRVFLLSGTPALSRPLELYSQLEACLSPAIPSTHTKYQLINWLIEMERLLWFISCLFLRVKAVLRRRPLVCPHCPVCQSLQSTG